MDENNRSGRERSATRCSCSYWESFDRSPEESTRLHDATLLASALRRQPGCIVEILKDGTHR